MLRCKMRGDAGASAAREYERVAMRNAHSDVLAVKLLTMRLEETDD